MPRTAVTLAATAGLVGLLRPVAANDNGLAQTPPLGWRSWNLYGANVNQALIQSIMDGMIDKSRTVNGVPTSLLDLGYSDVGLDDNWQACGSKDAAPGMHYHDKDGNPLVNYDRFPDFNNMTDHAHSLGLTSGWCEYLFLPPFLVVACCLRCRQQCAPTSHPPHPHTPPALPPFSPLQPQT